MKIAHSPLVAHWSAVGVVTFRADRFVESAKASKWPKARESVPEPLQSVAQGRKGTVNDIGMDRDSLFPCWLVLPSAAALSPAVYQSTLR